MIAHSGHNALLAVDEILLWSSLSRSFWPTKLRSSSVDFDVVGLLAALTQVEAQQVVQRAVRSGRRITGDGCEWSEPSSRPVLWAGAALNGPWAPTAMSTKVCSCATHKYFFKCKALELYFEGLGCQVVIGPDVYFKEFLSATHPLSAGLYT